MKEFTRDPDYRGRHMDPREHTRESAEAKDPNYRGTHRADEWPGGSAGDQSGRRAGGGAAGESSR